MLLYLEFLMDFYKRSQSENHSRKRKRILFSQRRQTYEPFSWITTFSFALAIFLLWLIFLLLLAISFFIFHSTILSTRVHRCRRYFCLQNKDTQLESTTSMSLLNLWLCGWVEPSQVEHSSSYPDWHERLKRHETTTKNMRWENHLDRCCWDQRWRKGNMDGLICNGWIMAWTL